MQGSPGRRRERHDGDGNFGRSGQKLREQTGAGMMECKNALTEANGDFEEANTILRKRGLASAARRRDAWPAKG